MDLSLIIKKLLLSKKIAVLPGFGAVKAVYKPAKVSQQQKKIDPPSTEIIFDPSASYEDDVLWIKVKEFYKLNEDEAKKKVKDYVEQIRKKTAAEGKFEMQGIGSFSKGTNNKIIFTGSPKTNFFPETFGLDSSIVSPIKETKSKETKEKSKISDSKKEKEPIPSGNEKKKPLVLYIVLGIVAACIIVLLIPQFTNILRPLKINFAFLEKNHQPYFDSTEFTALLDTIKYPGDEKKDTLKTVDDILDHMTEKQNALAVNFENDSIKKAQDEPSTYCIIAASFAEQDRAKVMEKSLQSKGYTTQIIHKDGRYRVAIDTFSEKQVALKELNKVRQVKGNEKFWLLKI